MAPDSPRDAWNRLSPHYQRMRSIPTHQVCYGPFAPGEERLGLLGDVQGKRVLELGCGGGQASISLARQGALCTAVDFSEEQIRFAEGLAASEGVSVAFRCADMADYLRQAPPAAYHLVLSVLALQYVEHLGPLFALVRRALVEGGLFVFSLDHPFGRLVRMREGQAVLTCGYFERGPMCWEWEGLPAGLSLPFVSFHRTVADIHGALVEAGFRVERLLEPEPTDEHAASVEAEEIERLALVPAVILWQARAGG